MTEIVLNSIVQENFSSKNLKFNELVESITNEITKDDNVITKISVDGKALNLEEEDILGPTLIQNFNRIEIISGPANNLIFDAIDSAPSYIDLMSSKINQLTSLYQENKIQEANIQFVELVEIVDLYTQLMAKISNNLRKRSDGNYKKSNSIKELEIHLLSILKALIPAREKNDIIMLCDLLEYELADNLAQWKIKVIPELKKLRTL